MNFKIVKQPNNFTCYPAVLSMITGKSFEEIFEVLGHDGSGIIDIGDDLIHKGFFDQEAMIFLLMNGWVMGASMTGPAHQDCQCEELKKLPAIVTVKSFRFKGRSHVVLYYNGKVYDPNPEITGHGYLIDYEVEEWWPLSRLGSRFFRNLDYTYKLRGE